MSNGHIHRDLIRQVITDPLFQEVEEQPAEVHNVIIDVNMEYYSGREAAFARVTELAEMIRKALAGEGHLPDGITLPDSVGSPGNPYMRGHLSGIMIERMIAEDLATAQQAARDAWDERAAQRESGAPPPASMPPSQIRRYRAIFRVWKNFEVRALIDRSVATVKADAARRAFLAEGKDIVWAVIDSGIDRRHIHFEELENLVLGSPVRHCDFTVPNGAGPAGAESALVDNFGHGTHVAGIIGGQVLKDRPNKPEAKRTRLVGTQEVTEDEPISRISGMAPACKLVSMKVLNDSGFGDVAGVIEAIDTIQQINDHGRRLLIHGVNLSIGYEFDPKWFACGQSPVCIEVDRLVRSGVVVVVAAGNTGYGKLAAQARSTGAGFMLTINDPGNADLAITVGATHRDMPHTYGVSYFSSKGPTGDGRLKPDLVAPGERILSCLSTRLDPAAPTNQYVEDSGTSMAAPHVAGVIAAFLSIRREYIGKAEAVKRLFMDAATDLGRDRTFQGRGLVDLMRAIQTI